MPAASRSPKAIGRGDAALAARLEQVQAIRRFASRDLGLPDNGSYTRYADLGRPFVTWNVFATPGLSLEPRRWCFPIAGCVDYRGYFDEAAAKREATRLTAEGDDVYVGGVPAYSTLGWFDDPVLSTFIRWPETEVARLVFHELAHQLLYVKDDTVFNESFATTVEEVGLERWLAAQKNPVLTAQAARADRLRAVFRHLLRTTRAKLAQLYASGLDDAAKLRAKREAFAAMKTAYEAAKAGEPGLAGYDRWFAHSPNNASLAAVGHLHGPDSGVQGIAARGGLRTCRGSTPASGALRRWRDRSATGSSMRPPRRIGPTPWRKAAPPGDCLARHASTAVAV